jgi:parallel beta-helix repeat protein
MMPITLKGASPSKTIHTNKANGDGLRLISASYWLLKDFSVTNARRGIVLEYATNNNLTNLNVHHTNYIAIRIQYNSTDNQVLNSTISYTGLADSSNGEGVYNGRLFKKKHNSL